MVAVADFNWEDEASRCCEFFDVENGHRFFFNIPALKLALYFTGIETGTTTAIFSVKRR